MRRGVECAFRARAAVDVLFSAGLPGLCEKRSGRGVFVDLMVRIEVYAMASCEVCETFCWMRKRVAEGMRKDGGSRAQLKGVLGGIVDVGWVSVDSIGILTTKFGTVIFGMSSGQSLHVKSSS